ncbi:hypothetical protein ALC53_11705 [Atta colombica]|uniref:Uncharacterized protein n=1 Tax=Atta colombica TaxID=520822 RepID=A0A195B079_9HYME|nr:hypothetical protein ALC53_11705 [Atta colombica]
MEKERKTEGERPVGWPYFLSGELYGAGLCVMTAEWIIISLSLFLSLSLSLSLSLFVSLSLSPSLFLFFSANPFAVSESPSGRLSVSCKEAHPGRVLFSAKTCKPEPRHRHPPPPPPPFSTPASLSAPSRPAMAPTARKYTPISRPCYPRIPQFIFPCADPRESRFIGRRRECPRLRARSSDGIPADGTASCLLLPSNSFFLQWG